MNYKPHVSADKNVREFSLRATTVGMLFGFFFAIANAYLALKVGTTVSASIPAAIMSMTLLKVLFRNTTILENNIVQTIATMGEGLAAGVVFTIPALILLGDPPSVGRVFLLSSLGGILGILFMIPMRRFLIVAEHKTLPYPEGTACAEILKAGEKNTGSSSMRALWGFCIAAVYKICSNIFFVWQETFSWTATFFKNTQFSLDATPSLMGVGYIIGPKNNAILFAGGVLAWWVIIPLIKVFGIGDAEVYPSVIAINEMGAADIWSSYVRYVGAGALAVGGLLSLIKIAPLLYKTLAATFREIFHKSSSSSKIKRTDRDIPMVWLILGSVAIILTLWLFPTLPMNFFTIVLLVLLSFFFVAVTSMTVGIVGSTSNPVSGMTITTLLIVCIAFVLLGWTERIYLISAITMGCVACSAICIAGTTAQDLKTGFLLGATPKSQQIAEIIGILLPALALGYVISILNSAYHIGSDAMPAPQATLLAMIAKGVISGGLPYALIGVGIVLGLLMALLNVPILPFALGVYLPLSLTSAMMCGGLARLYADSRAKKTSEGQQCVLFAAGLVGGDACLGIFVAILTVAGVIPTDAPGILPNVVSLIAFGLLGIALARSAYAARKK